MREALAAGAEEATTGAAGIAARSASLKESGETPPPVFPVGGVSPSQHWALPRPVAVAGRVLDAGGEVGEVAAGLGVRAGVGLVEVAEASR